MRKGQVTLFIIIGIIILLSIATVIYFTTQRAVVPVEEEVVIPADIKPVHDFIADCTYDIAKQGLIRMGLQGGYITMPPAVARVPGSYISLDPLGVVKTPHWYYNGEDRTPSPFQMQRGLGIFVRDNLNQCINNFTALPEFTVLERGRLFPTVTFTDQEVIVQLDWPLEIQTKERTVLKADYVQKLDVPVKRMWQLANQTMMTENRRAWFENFTIDLMAADPEIPMDGLVVECGTRRWNLNTIKERLQSVLYYNLPFVRLGNTRYLAFNEPRRVYERLEDEHKDIMQALEAGADTFSPPDYTPRDAYEYFRMTFDVGVAPTDLKASFVYLPRWGMELNAQPREGSILKSNSMPGSRLMRFLCLNQWHFAYDAIYPIMMAIKSDSAFRGEGYVFQFSFPVHIDDNEGIREYYGLRRLESIEFAIDFCDRLGDQSADIRVRGFVPGAPVAVELDGVNITYRCFDQECMLGTTKVDEGYYRLRTLLPEGCANPFITATKSGHLPTRAQLVGPKLDMTMPKLQSMSYRILKHRYQSDVKELVPDPVELGKNERASIYLAVKETTVPYDQFKDAPAEDTIDFVSRTAKYNLNIIVHDAFGVIIGGYNADNLEIEYDELADKSTVDFHVLEYTPYPRTDEAKGDMIRLIYEETYRENLTPTFR